jgi:dihydrofolate reductase
VIVSLIAAMDRKRGIGVDNNLPWRLSADLRRFRDLTMGHHIIVGRRTFESIGRPLPGRQTIVVTHDRDYRCEGCFVVNSVEEAISLADMRGEDELFVCGGSQIYEQSIGLADRIYLTLVEADVEADRFFPAFDEGQWSEMESLHRPADEKNQYPSTFRLLVRKRDEREER